MRWLLVIVAATALGATLGGLLDYWLFTSGIVH